MHYVLAVYVMMNSWPTSWSVRICLYFRTEIKLTMAAKFIVLNPGFLYFCCSAKLMFYILMYRQQYKCTLAAKQDNQVILKIERHV